LLKQSIRPHPLRPGERVTHCFTRHELEDLAAAVVVTQWFRREVKAFGTHVTQECVDRGRPWTGCTAYRVADTDDPVQLPAGERDLRIAHLRIMPYVNMPANQATLSLCWPREKFKPSSSICRLEGSSQDPGIQLENHAIAIFDARLLNGLADQGQSYCIAPNSA
jgi:hypothetical protein